MLSFKVLNSLRSLHIEAIDWHNRVVSNGGSVSPTTLKAVSDFCRGIDSAGIRNKFLRLNLFCGNNLDACFTPLYRGPSYAGTKYGNTKEDNIGPFIPSNYVERGTGAGLSGGTGSYLDTHLDTSTPFTDIGISYTNFHSSVYLSKLGIGGGWMGGTIDGNVVGFNAFPGDYAGKEIFWYNNSLSYNIPANTYSLESSSCATQGLIIGNFQTSNNKYLIENNDCTTAYNTSGGGGGSYNSPKIYIMAGPGGADIYYPDIFPYVTDDTVAGYSIGIGMTSSEITSFYKTMTAFQKLLGRNI